MLVCQRFALSCFPPPSRLPFLSGNDFLYCIDFFNCNVTHLPVFERLLCCPAFSLGVCPEMKFLGHIIILPFQEPVFWVIFYFLRNWHADSRAIVPFEIAINKA